MRWTQHCLRLSLPWAPGAHTSRLSLLRSAHTRLPSRLSGLRLANDTGPLQHSMPCLEHTGHSRMIHCPYSVPAAPSRALPRSSRGAIFSLKVTSGIQAVTLLLPHEIPPHHDCSPAPASDPPPPCNQSYTYFNHLWNQPFPRLSHSARSSSRTPSCPLSPRGGAERPQECQWFQGPASPDWLHLARMQQRGPRLSQNHQLPPLPSPNPHKGLPATLERAPWVLPGRPVRLPGSGVQRDTEHRQITFKGAVTLESPPWEAPVLTQECHGASSFLPGATTQHSVSQERWMDPLTAFPLPPLLPSISSFLPTCKAGAMRSYLPAQVEEGGGGLERALAGTPAQTCTQKVRLCGQKSLSILKLGSPPSKALLRKCHSGMRPTPPRSPSPSPT